MIYSIKHSDLKRLINRNSKTYEIIGPVRKDHHISFEKTDCFDDLHLKQNCYSPLKKFFLPHIQERFRFEKGKLVEKPETIPQRIFVGVKLCDLNAIMHHENLFVTHYHDPIFKELRDKSLLIGYLCKEECNPYCFCGSLDLKKYYDLMLIEADNLGKEFLVDTNSKKGEDFIKKNKTFFKKTSKKLDIKLNFADRLKKKDISMLYSHKDWEKGSEKCLSCGACTVLCPTCYCFELRDEPSVKNLSNVSRLKEWSSCQLQSFTKVAGGHVFRKERLHRFKHRIYHQLDYFKKRYNINLCTGCGRCIEHCPTRIDFVKLINEMK